MGAQHKCVMFFRVVTCLCVPPPFFRWTEVAKQLGIKFTNLIGDVLVSSGVVAYLGAFTAAFRQVNLMIFFFLSVGKQPMSHDATSGFLVSLAAVFVYDRCVMKQKRLLERLRDSPRTSARNSILMMCHYPHLGGTSSDWSCREGNYFSQSEVLNPDLGSNTSLVWNLARSFVRLISRGNQ